MKQPKTIGENANRKRFNKSVIIYVVILAVGLLFGAGVALLQNNQSNLTTPILICVAVLLVIFMYAMTWIYYSSMDEFEKKRFNEAGNVAFQSGFIGFAWFILSEFNILPKLEAIYLLLGMAIVNMTYYYFKKFF